MPIRLFEASIESVLESKFRASTAAFNVTSFVASDKSIVSAVIFTAVPANTISLARSYVKSEGHQLIYVHRHLHRENIILHHYLLLIHYL